LVGDDSFPSYVDNSSDEKMKIRFDKIFDFDVKSHDVEEAWNESLKMNN
jgi:hypothetical protein